MTLNEATAAALAILNGSAITASAYPTVSSSKKWPTPHVQRMLTLAARKKLGEYAADPDHPGRAGLVTTVTPAIVNGGTLPARLGPVTGVQVTQATGGYKPGLPDDRDVVQRRVDNVLGLQVPVYHFAFDGELVYHTGTGLIFQYVSPTALDDNGGAVDVVAKVLRSDELDVLAEALATLVPFEGEDVEAAQFWKGLAGAGLDYVRGGGQ